MLTPEFGHWLAGFVDGEGCFTIAKRPHGRFPKSRPPHYVCMFQLGIRADDRPLLERIREETGLGAICMRQPTKLVPNAKPVAVWSVYRMADVIALRDLFVEFPLRSKKARDFAVWSSALDIWATREKGDAVTTHALADLRDALKEGRCYRPDDAAEALDAVVRGGGEKAEEAGEA